MSRGSRFGGLCSARAWRHTKPLLSHLSDDDDGVREILVHVARDDDAQQGLESAVTASKQR